MRGVERGEGYLVVHFDHDEPGLLAGVVDQVLDILEESAPTVPAPDRGRRPVGGDDPFARWEAEFSVEDDQLDQLDGSQDDELDPVVRRLFPDAYRDDPAASRDFRRFTQAEQREAKLREGRIVVADLQGSDRRSRCFVQLDHVDAWLKTLTAVRLALAVRLDITDEVSADEAAQRPDDDPRSWLHEVYAWVGWLQESLIDAL